MKIISLNEVQNETTYEIEKISVVFQDNNGTNKPVTINKGSDIWERSLELLEDFKRSKNLVKFTEQLGKLTMKFNALDALFSDKFEDNSRVVFNQNTNSITIDGEPVNDTLVRHMIQISEQSEQGDKDANCKAFMNFIENLYNGESRFVRDQLFSWLMQEFTRSGNLTITPDGCFIAYKGFEFADDECDKPSNERKVQSVFSGRAFVNDELHIGKIPNAPGDIVTMKRNTVQDDPEVGCSFGLHVGTYDYASNWGKATYAIKVNPKHVVSVPTECEAQKIRCCEYEVLEYVTEPYKKLTFINIEADEVDIENRIQRDKMLEEKRLAEMEEYEDDYEEYEDDEDYDESSRWDEYEDEIVVWESPQHQQLENVLNDLLDCIPCPKRLSNELERTNSNDFYRPSDFMNIDRFDMDDSDMISDLLKMLEKKISEDLKKKNESESQEKTADTEDKTLEMLRTHYNSDAHLKNALIKYRDDKSYKPEVLMRKVIKVDKDEINALIKML